MSHVPAGDAFGEMLREDFRGCRDEPIISTKAGRPIWPGPHGEAGSRKRPIASCDRSLKRLGPDHPDHVDIFCSHLPFAALRSRHAAGGHHGRAGAYPAVGPGALHRDLVLQREAHRRGGGGPARPRRAGPGAGAIAVTPQARGRLAAKGPAGIPAGSRAAQGRALRPERITGEVTGHLRAPCASRPEQAIGSAGAAASATFAENELDDIGRLTGDRGINPRSRSSEEV